MLLAKARSTPRFTGISPRANELAAADQQSLAPPCTARRIDRYIERVNDTIRDADWNSLVNSVNQGMCTLMLGPDAVTGTLKGERLSVHVALARFVKDQLIALDGSRSEFTRLDPTKPASVAQAAMTYEDPFTLQAWAEDFYEVFVEEDEVLRDLAALPFELVINTSPGASVQRVFEALKPDTRTDFYDRTGAARTELPDPSHQAPIVYNLYGSLEQPSSMILSDSDQLDFIVSVVNDRPPLPPKLKAAFYETDRSFLFLGFDLAQWQFRLLMHVLSKDTRRRYKSFALEPSLEQLDDETADYYRAGHKIYFQQSDIAEFVSELRERVDVPEPDGPPSPESDRLDPDAPVAFLCHASEDEHEAKQLADALKANGISPWLDKNELKAGDEWHQKIKKAITEDIDYFVVLQSANMISKDIGYVNREISAARERLPEFRTTRQFIFPVVLDDPSSMLEEFESLQSVDVRTPHGVDELVRAIKRDLKKDRNG